MRFSLTALMLQFFFLSVPILTRAAAIRDTITRGNYTLIVVNNAPDFSPETRQRLIDAFFIVYPEEATRFNTNTLKQVTFFIEPTYTGVAETGNGTSRFN